MPQTSIVDEEKAKKAVNILLWMPQLTVWEAMILADFIKDQANMKSMQRKVARSISIDSLSAMDGRDRPLLN
jgi:hypothetical protein